LWLPAQARQPCPPEQGTIKRRLPIYATPAWRQSLAAACAARAGLRPASLVLFDVSTLYFETDTGDGFRELGFSKERRLEPQITLGLLVSPSPPPLEPAPATPTRGNRADRTEKIDQLRDRNLV
jgi:hypothetical protein